MLKELSIFPRLRSERGLNSFGLGLKAAMLVLRNQRQEDCCKFKASWATLAKLALKTKQQTSKMKTNQNKTKPNHCAFQTVKNFYCKGQNLSLQADRLPAQTFREGSRKKRKKSEEPSCRKAGADLAL